jgi:hypothetical protein
MGRYVSMKYDIHNWYTDETVFEIVTATKKGAFT